MSLACVTLLDLISRKRQHMQKSDELHFEPCFFALFLLGGQILWKVGFVMMAGSILGANLGAKMVMTKGKTLIRPMVVIMSL